MLAVLVCIASVLLAPQRSYAFGNNRLDAAPAVPARSPHDKPQNLHPSGAIAFTYKFENPRFYIPIINLQINADGTSKLSFKQGESDDTIDQTLTLRPETIDKLAELISRSRFLESNDDYQSKKDFSHLGWITITATEGEHHRTVRFNYTQNKDVSDLADIFRAIANQWIDLFQIQTAVEHQPLDLPARLDALENDLQLERLAEPEQLQSPLRDISLDDTLPLIARNQAKRIIAAIQKRKYKSPVDSAK